MSHSSLPLNSKLFQLTSLSCALALAGCGGGDGTDIVAPRPDLGVKPGDNNNGGNTGGSGGETQTPAEDVDFHLQKLYTTPANIELSDEPVVFSVTVKAAAKKSGSAVINKKVSLSVENTENNGVTIEGLSDQNTDDKGEATYELKLNPNVINEAQKADLLTNGFKLKATAKRQNGAVVEQVHTVSVRKKGSGDGAQVVESKLSIKTSLATTSVSNNKLNPYGDLAVLTVQAKSPNGAVASDVTVGASIMDVKGVSLDRSSQVTDEQGLARFTIRIDDDLSKDERDSLIRSGLFYNINIQEKNGATKKISNTLSVANPVSDYTLGVSGNNSLNAYGDSQTLLIKATANNSNVPTSIDGAKAFITLNNDIDGVTLSSNEVTLDNKGQAAVTLNVAKSLSQAARTQIARDGIGYTVSLMEPNRSTTTRQFRSSAYIPQAQYQVGFVSTSKPRISSFGSTVDVVFRVNDNKNAPVVGQTVIASLPTDLAQKGLLLLDNDARQTTDQQGQVKYTVVVPSGLSSVNRELLEKSGGFVLNAQAIEASGASSQTSSARVQITTDSETLLTTKTVPSVVNILKDQFEIVVNSKRPDGSVAVGKVVKLTINNTDGISIQNSQQTTNSSGQVVFIVNVSQDLSQQQRDKLIASGIDYTVTLTDSDGIASVKDTAKVAMPVALYQLNYAGASQTQLSSSGGSTTVTFRVNNKQGGVVKGERVIASLPESLTSKGYISLDGTGEATTDNNGEVSFVVRVAGGLSDSQRKDLESQKQIIVQARTIEASGASSQIQSPAIAISSKVQQSLSRITSQSNPSVVNVLKDRFEIITTAKRPDGSAVAGKAVRLVVDNQAITVDSDEVFTNNEGVARFSVSLAKLTQAQREVLAKTGITYTATLTDDDGVVSVKDTAKAEAPAAQYQINFAGLSRNELSSSGGSTTVTFRVNNKDGGIIKDQIVAAVLPKALTDKGLLTLDGSSTQKTNDKGEVSFTIRVPTGLNADQRKQLEQASGFKLTTAIVETSGASSTTTSAPVTVSAQGQQSATELSSSTTPSVVNVLQDSFQIQVMGKRPNGSAAAGNQVELTLAPNQKGLSIEGNTATTDSKGVAVFTVNIDPALSANERKVIADKGISYSTTLTDTDGRVSGNFKANAEVPAAKYRINFAGLSRNELSSFGGSTTVTFRVNDEFGGVIKDQMVGVFLPEKLTDNGLLTLDDLTIRKTNENGEISYTIRVPDGLNDTQRDQLEEASGFKLTALIVETSGASSTTTSAPINVSAAGQQSATELSSSTTPSVVNVLQDSFQIRVLGKRPNGSAAAGKTVKLDLDPIKGVSVQGDTVTTDSKGVAVFTVNIDPALSENDRENIAAANIKYTATLSDTDGDISGSFEAQAEMPDAQYQINFDKLTSNQLLSVGGSTTLTFRVNDKQGGIVKGQRVIAELPDDTLLRGLISLESESEQITDAKGEVKYTVRIPTGLTQTQRKALEDRAKVFLKAYAIEASGAKTNIASAPILIKAGEIELIANSSPQVVDIATAESFNINVLSRYPDSSAAFGKNVKLSIDKPTIFTIPAGSYITNSEGKVNFKVNIDPNLTEQQKNDFVASGIKYTVIVLDENGVQTEVTNTIKVIKSEAPTSTINFASILSPSISEFGGDGLIKVKLATKTAPATAIANKNVKLELDAQALSYGVKVKNNSAVTDFSGEANFEISIPEKLSAAKREALKKSGINYRLSFEENGETYTSSSQKVGITTPTVALTVLNAPTQINSRPAFTLNDEGESVAITAQLSNKSENSQIAAQPVKFAFNDKALAQLLTVNNQIGSAEVTAATNAEGTVSFNVTVPNNLTKAQKDQFKNKVLTATLTETLTGKTQQVNVKVQSVTAGLSLLYTQAKLLNLSGGETQIEVTAQNSDKNVAANQKVFFALPAAIASQGVTLLTDTQITNDSGKAVFTLAVPNNLTDKQKAAIGASFNFALSAVDGVSNQIVTKLGQVNTIKESSNGTQESISVGANKVVNTKGDAFKVFVRVKDNSGAIADRDVRLNVDDPVKTGVTITNNTAKTNGDGVATFDLKLEAGANVNQALLEKGIKLTARTTTTENVELKQDYIVAVDTTTIDSYQILVSSDKPTLNTGGDQTNATFRVTDGKGGALQGVPVQLSINNLAISGAALTTPSVVTTDSSGKIDVGVLLAANSINARLNHEIKIDAKIVTPVYDVNGDVTLQTREEKELVLSAVGTKIDLSAATSRLKDGEAATVTTLLVDGSGLAIANAAMELVDETGNLISSNATGTTDADGKAVINIREDQLNFDNNGNLRIYARAAGENRATLQRSTTSVNLIKDSRAGISFTDIQEVYEVNQPQAISIQIRTDSPEQAAALVGKSVEVQTSLGGLIANYLDKFNNDVIVTKPIKEADIQGNNINVKVWLKSSLAGTAVVQATVLGENLQNGAPRYQVSADTRFKAVTPAKMLLQPVKTVINPGGSTEVVAIVKDRNDAPVEGQTVVFSRSADSSAGRLSAATAVTDSKGEARVVYQANANSPIGGVVINARLLEESFGIGTKTTNITVSKEAVYTTLAFSNKLSSDSIYYTVQGSISVMDGSGRAVANQEVSIKSYAIEYAQGQVCKLDSTITYQPRDVEEIDSSGAITRVPQPERKLSETTPEIFASGWLPTEDSNYNYTLDKDNIVNEDANDNGQLESINPVAIIGGTVSDDGYTFVTDNEGRADFNIRYPMHYSRWVKVRFDASTFVNGSENIQSINYTLPVKEGDVAMNNRMLMSPWISNESPFGNGGVTCVNNISVTINEASNKTQILLAPAQNYFATINGEWGRNYINNGIFVVDFNKAFELGSMLSVNSNGFSFNKVLKVD